MLWHWFLTLGICWPIAGLLRQLLKRQLWMQHQRLLYLRSPKVIKISFYTLNNVLSFNYVILINYIKIGTLETELYNTCNISSSFILAIYINRKPSTISWHNSSSIDNCFFLDFYDIVVPTIYDLLDGKIVVDVSNRNSVHSKMVM